MDRILKLLRPLLDINYKYPFSVVAVAIITAVAGGYFAVHLKIDTDLANLLPHKNEHVRAMDSLQATVGGESDMVVAIESPSFADNKRFARDLIEQSLKLQNNRSGYFFERGSYKRNTGMLKDNALYFATSDELNDITDYLKQQIKESNKKANPFLVDFGAGEEKDTTSKDKMKDFQKIYSQLIPPTYSVNKDSTVLLVQLTPTGSKSDLTYLRNMFSKYDSLVTAMQPASYNPQMEVHYSNRLHRHLIQIGSIKNDVFRSFATGISSVIILVMIYFFIKKYVNYQRGAPEERHHGFFAHVIRMPVPILLIGIPLLISLAWTFGITYAVLGTLNTMTSVLFVILFGMGIDYGIHFYARYIENRSEGMMVREAIFATYDNTGAAITVSGLTTAFSLLILIIARFRGFSEFGFISGLGIILALFCMLFVLPAILVIFERWNWVLVNKNIGGKSKARSFSRFPWARTIVAVGVILSVIVLFNVHKLQFQYNFGKLEPKIESYRNFRQISSPAQHTKRRSHAYLLADNRKQSQEIVDSLRHRMRTDTTSPTILEVQSLAERYPAGKQEIDAKLDKIAKIRQLLENSIFTQKDSPKLDTLRRASKTTSAIKLSQIPDFFKKRFTNKKGKVGNFVIVYPSVGLNDGRNSIDFKNDVGEVTLANGQKKYAAGTSIIAAEMLELMRNESPWMVGATLVMVFLLMWLSFGSIRWTIIAMLPLLVGLLFLFGIMLLTGMMFNLYNLVVLPAILGIGEDNGVHIAARYREEGQSKMGDVISSTGQHISIGSITTMLGFSGLILTTHPGLQSLGLMAVIGVGMTLLTALTFLPALIQVLEDREWI